jgi:pullulanase/glycogen debranching enzyme
MYELFGGTVDQTKKIVTFQLFFPDGEQAPEQYDGGGLPRIKAVSVVGSFQIPAWDMSAPVAMPSSVYEDPVSKLVKGTLYSCEVGPLPDGFYEYKYLVEFENAMPRLVTDPCAKYGGSKNQNSGFVVGGTLLREVNDLKGERLPYSDLIVYELMIDDFTAKYKAPTESPLEAIVRKLDDLVGLGINAIEFMPWTAWTYPDDPSKDDFSWGYNPVQYFSVAHKYTLDPSSETDKLVHLRDLISECHDRGIQVLMDGVFNHADAEPPNLGFPYYWTYEEPADSPYVGNFEQHAFFQDLDYANRCTLEYIRDACIYWMEKFKIDGFRFDNTEGFYKADDRGHGLPKLLSELRGYLSKTKSQNFATVLEHAWDYSSIDVTNKVGATSCWLDPYRGLSMGFLGDRPQGIPQIESSIMRMLDSGRDYDAARTPTVYIENHDHRRFMLKAGGRPFWYLTQPYVLALFTSSGAVLVYNGQEYGADNDMPESGDGRVVPRPLDWNGLQADPGQKVFALYSLMMNLRKNHKGLRSPNFYPRDWDESQTSMNAHGFGIDRVRNVVVYHRWGDDGTGKTERVYVALIFSQGSQTVSFEVPSPGPWNELLSGATVTSVNGRIEAQIGSNWGAIYQRID